MSIVMKSCIVVKLQMEWIHKREWCDIDEVSFLKNDHRHIFYIKCKKVVTHHDRDIEIIKLKREIEKYLTEWYCKPLELNNTSCEMLAEELIIAFGLCSCEVLEDNENWAYLSYNF